MPLSPHSLPGWARLVLEESHARQICSGTAAPFGAQAFQPAEKSSYGDQATASTYIMCVYIYMYTYMYIYICIHIYICKIIIANTSNNNHDTDLLRHNR